MKKTLLATLILLSTTVSAHDIGHEHQHTEGGWNAAAGFISDTDHTAKLWSPRGKSQQQINQRAAFLVQSFDASRTDEERAQDAKIRARYPDTVVINSLMPSGVGIQGVQEKDFARAMNKNRDAGVTLISGSVWGFEGVNDVSFQDTLARTDAELKKLGIEKISSVPAIRKAKQENRMVAMYNSQGADYVIEDLSQVAQSKSDGIQVMNFTYNNDNALAGGGQNPENNGVSKLGKAFIAQANKHGVIVDVSHSSDQTAIDAAKWSAKPILASHSNAKGLYNTGRNLSDEAILAIGKNNGAVCTNGVGLFLNDTGSASMQDIAEHVEYTANLIGRDKTCYGSDYSHTYADFLKAFIKVVDKYPPEKGFGAPTENSGGGDIWGVAQILEDKYNWSAQDIRGFLGENLMRVYAANWN